MFIIWHGHRHRHRHGHKHGHRHGHRHAQTQPRTRTQTQTQTQTDTNTPQHTAPQHLHTTILRKIKTRRTRKPKLRAGLCRAMPRAADIAMPCASKEAQVVVAPRLAVAAAAERLHGGDVGEAGQAEDGAPRNLLLHGRARPARAGRRPDCARGAGGVRPYPCTGSASHLHQS